MDRSRYNCVEKSRPISHDVSFLTPSYPKGKAIFELSGFGTIFFAIGLIPRTE